MTYSHLNAEKALIWRITHKDNISGILDNGLYCANSPIQIPCYTPIGNIELIGKRKNRIVSLHPGGTLSDYIPFYFTHFSPMMYNIHTGRGVKQYHNSELLILVSSLRLVEENNLEFLFTDRHAYLQRANYYNNLDSLSEIDWLSLQQRDFRLNPEDPEKFDRYQAEALIYNHLPINSLKGIVCYTDELKLQIENEIDMRNLSLTVVTKPRWYF
ncbi:type II toxin-antitoxin system toxin DNA ADP-ribosyl transferase DarT [Legionella fallonii]|uniref:DarT domain-containing protein n=1 Tax=Legionella fallonii LLAP-10 TaxID=1212491 RepID=A0A098FZP2_9GAMM|nr:DUF4433 domain-containing protein [Legionella fallonii]CEG55703.1 conserved protein of unknown function [Legionella fallonii LLAP-10]